MKSRISFILVFAALFFVGACTKRSMEGDLIGASGTGNIQEVKRLLSQGVSVNCKDNSLNAWTPLIWASYEGKSQTVQVLLEAGADPNIQDWRGHTALFYALKPSDQSEIVKALILAGARTEELKSSVERLDVNDPNRIAFESAVKLKK